MKDLNLEIITPEKILYSGDVSLIQLPGMDGSFTILKDHASIISALTKGVIRVIGKNGNEETFKCNNGVFECKENKASALIDKVDVEDK